MYSADKIKHFEYFLSKLVDWFCEFYEINVENFNECPENNLSKLKVFKLHFFACSTNTESLNIFKDFKALPYGHVENEIYGNLAQFSVFELTNKKLKIKKQKKFKDLQGKEISQKGLIDQIVCNLKKENEELIAWKPFDLVELSHKYFSWRYTFKEARDEHKFAKSINPELIKREEKFYQY